MTKAELLAALQLQCWKVFPTDKPFGGVKDENNDFTGDANEYKWGTVQMAPRGTRKAQNVHVLVTDEGTANESATLVGTPIDMPVGDTLQAVLYLEGLKGTEWVSYDYESGKSEQGWFIITAQVEEAGVILEKRFRISRDENGDPTHTLMG